MVLEFGMKWSILHLDAASLASDKSMIIDIHSL